MSIQFYNTLSNKKEKFIPINDQDVKIYLCGPTVYDFLHIGNFRGAITYNLLRNWMEYSGLKVTMVYNYTDVDDKIIKRANAEGVDSTVISERFIKEFEKDFSDLGLRKHDHNPKVTDYIPQIIEFVETLVKNEKAYVVEGEVFYHIDSFENYGKLSGKKLDELEAGTRVDVDKRKKSPFDFVLWKPSKENEPSWDSPWGKGRPGWHIECSAMIKSILGETIDIHGGGIDLIFPHHENEIAQGEGCNCKTYCNYWIHNEFISLGDSEKMSKSLGNVITMRSFNEKYHPEILKYLYLSAHYRSRLVVSDDKIEQTIGALDRIYSSLSLARNVMADVEGSAAPDKVFVKTLESLDGKIKKSLDDDLNSAEFISFVFEAVRSFNSLGFRSKKWNEVHKANSNAFFNWMKKYGEMSALFSENPDKIIERFDDILISLKDIDRKTVESLVDQRNKAREDKDWVRSDELRDELAAMNIELFDGHARGWRVKRA